MTEFRERWNTSGRGLKYLLLSTLTLTMGYRKHGFRLSPEHCQTPLRYQTSSAFLVSQEREPFASLYGDGHDRVWFLPRGDYELTLARLAAAPGISIGRTVTKTVTNAGEFVLSQMARCYSFNGAILQEINGEKRPKKTKDYFIVSNSTLFEINVIFF